MNPEQRLVPTADAPQDVGTAAPRLTSAVPENTNWQGRRSARAPSSRFFAILNRSKLLIAFLGLLGAAIAPVTTLIYKNAEMELKTKELAHVQRMEEQKQKHSQVMEATKQQHEFQSDFLRDAISKDLQNTNLYYRRDVLEFYASVLEPANPVHAFAATMLSKVKDNISTQEQLRKRETELQTAEQENRTLKERIQRLAKNDIGQRNQLSSLQQDLSTRELQTAELRQQVTEARSRVATLTGVLRDRDPCPAGSVLTTSAGPDALASCATEAPKQPGDSLWTIAFGRRNVTCGCKPVSL